MKVNALHIQYSPSPSVAVENLPGKVQGRPGERVRGPERRIAHRHPRQDRLGEQASQAGQPDSGDVRQTARHGTSTQRLARQIQQGSRKRFPVISTLYMSVTFFLAQTELESVNQHVEHVESQLSKSQKEASQLDSQLSELSVRWWNI